MKEYFTEHDFPITFLFEPWVVNTVLVLVFTCVSAAVVAILFEGIRVFRVWVKRRFHVSPLYPILPRELDASGENNEAEIIPNNHSFMRKNRIRNHIIQAFIHVIRVAGGYFLMLAVMTYNTYIGISVLIGAGLGYFIFCHELTKWREPELLCATTSPSTTTSSANSTPPGEECHPMLATSSKCSTSRVPSQKI